jgi:hypothetical protein
MKMEDDKVFRAEDMEQEQLVAFVMDLFHRTMVHYTLWFREVEHQMGFAKALEALKTARARNGKIQMKRLAEVFGFEQKDGVPKALSDMPKEKLLSVADELAKNWLASDGIWFQAVEFTSGMNDAKRCNDSTWTRYSPFEAWSIKELLGLDEFPGLPGLARALNFRTYGRLNRQSVHWENENAFVYQMNECRVQVARVRQGLADYPCKSAGLVEYGAFAAAVDSRIKTECVGCPPDEHPSEWFCAWRFYIPQDQA